MKRLALLIFIVFISVSFWACGGKKIPASDPTADSGTAMATPEETFAPSDEPSLCPETYTPCVTEVNPEETSGPDETAAPTEQPTYAATLQPTDAPTLQPTDAPTEQPTDAPTKKPTDAPTQKPTATPTALPKPSLIPVGNKTKIAKLPDYYFDFTVDGEELMYFTRASNMHVDFDYDGIVLRGSSTSSDPHIYLTMPYIRRVKIDPTVYKYVAMRLISNRTDMNFELRFGTESDDALNACVSVPYANTTDWQTIVFKFEHAAGLSSRTLDGSALTQYRFDFFDGSKEIRSGDQIILESMAFFKTRAEAEAYAGLYKLGA